MNLVHSMSDWLALTASWIYDQVRHMPSDVLQTVWCDRLIPGPHDQWTGKVICEGPPSLWKRVCRRINRTANCPVLQPPSRAQWCDVDVLLSHFGTRAWHDYLHVKGKHLKRVVRFYGGDVGVTPQSPVWVTRYQQVFRHYDLFLCEGPHMAERLESLGAPRDLIHWVPLGIPSSVVVRHRAPAASLRDPLRVLIVGTFTEKKGIDIALRGILHFVGACASKVAVTVVGDARPGSVRQREHKERLLQLMNQVGRHPQCELKWLGYIPLVQLHALMERHLVMIAPSVTAATGDIEGGFPVSLTHAAAKGMILVGSDHCDLPLIVEDGVNGFVCPQGSSEHLADSLVRLAAMDDDDLDKLSQNSVRIAQSEFDAVSSGRRLATLFRGIT